MEQGYGGAFKDITSRIDDLSVIVAGYQRVDVDEDDPESVARFSRNGNIVGALVEYTHYPRIVRWLKSQCRNGPVAVRAHNIEPLQHFDNCGWWPKQGPLWVLYGMVRLLLSDVACRRCADVILPISDWESEVYWRRLPGRASVRWLPYYCPDRFISANNVPFGERRIVACIPTSAENRKSRDLVMRFLCFASAMKASGCPHEFIVTGDLTRWRLPPCAAVTYSGFVEDVFGFLARCRAIAVLSPYGYGFKTTLGDGLAAGARILAHPALLGRCPGSMRAVAMGVRTEAFDPLEVRRWLEQDRAGAEVEVHGAMRALSREALEETFGGLAG